MKKKNFLRFSLLRIGFFEEKTLNIIIMIFVIPADSDLGWINSKSLAPEINEVVKRN